MPDVTLKPSDLPERHAARTPSGRWTARARRLLRNRTIRSRGRDIPSPTLTPGDPVRNTALFYRIADEIEVFPEEYDQGEWGICTSEATPCRTAFCIAGHAAHFTGWRDDAGDWANVWHPSRKQVSVPVDWVARHELGLTDAESRILFSGGWEPCSDLTVSDALRLLGDGADVLSVTEDWDWFWGFIEPSVDARPPIRVTGRKPVYKD